MSTVNLVYFSWVRERIGKGEETLELPADVITIADLLAHLKTLCKTLRLSGPRRPRPTFKQNSPRFAIRCSV